MALSGGNFGSLLLQHINGATAALCFLQLYFVTLVEVGKDLVELGLHVIDRNFIVTGLISMSAVLFRLLLLLLLIESHCLLLRDLKLLDNLVPGHVLTTLLEELVGATVLHTRVFFFSCGTCATGVTISSDL